MIEVAVQLVGARRPIEAHLRVEEIADRVRTVGVESTDRGQWVRRDGLVVLHSYDV